MSAAIKPCVYCKKKQATDRFKPFCSKRCSDLDLGQWLDGGYAVPTQDSGDIPNEPE